MDKIKAMREFMASYEAKVSQIEAAQTAVDRAQCDLEQLSDDLGIPYDTEMGCYIPESFHAIVGGSFYDCDDWIEENELELEDEDLKVVFEFFNKFDGWAGCAEEPGHWLPSRFC